MGLGETAAFVYRGRTSTAPPFVVKRERASTLLRRDSSVFLAGSRRLMSTEDPSARGGERRSIFASLAEAGSNFTSSPAFFAICLALIATWGSGYALGLSDTFHHVSGEAMAAVSLLLLALLKNSELRAEQAIQEKLDAIAAALLEQRRGDSEAAQDDLERAIGLHEET
jgi:low affinity Fe/Cu permease